MLDTTNFPSCIDESFFIRNFRFFQEYKYPNQLALMRFRKLNGYYYNKLLFNFYFEEGKTFIFNFIRRGFISTDLTTETGIYDNVNMIDFSTFTDSSTKPNYQIINRISEDLKLCNSEMNKVSINDPCVCNI
jgi:hypothetical protein